MCKRVFKMGMMKQAQYYLQFGFWVMVFSLSGRKRAVELQHPLFCLTCCSATMGTDARKGMNLKK